MSLFLIGSRVSLGYRSAKLGAKLVSQQGIFSRCLSYNLKPDGLATPVREFIEENAKIMQPDQVHVCDGSQEENSSLVGLLLEAGKLKKLEKYENW